jgi:P-type conjugative transfer ATPase TrbB
MDTTVAEYARRTHEKLLRDFGPILNAALLDPRTIEIALNPDGRLWHERLNEPMRCIGHIEPARAEAIITTVASHLGKEVTRQSPLLEGELPPDGARFAAQLPPIVTAPTFSIRKPAISSISLEAYRKQGALSSRQHAALQAAVREHRNILVVGGTSSGKTTFVNALIEEMVASGPHERLVILEDTREIRCAADNCVQYRSSPTTSMTHLLRATLRMRPDRILVGEVRGPEALDLLMAWNTGHEGGAATVHSNNALAGLVRLEMLVSMHRDAPARIQPLIAAAVDVVVHITRTPEGRRVQEMVRVLGYEHGEYRTQPFGEETAP